MKNKILKTLPIAAVAATSLMTMIPNLTSCSNANLQTILSKIKGVVKVDKLEDMPQFKERYMVWFKQQIDWKDPSVGYFNQRVEVDFNDFNAVTQFFTCGYELRPYKEQRKNDFEIANRYSANVVKPEYRFFDQSKPDGLDQFKVAGWKYLTNTNAVRDFHEMVIGLKTVLRGKWVFTGTSKGGETSNVYAMTYPNDFNVYVPYVAPRFYKRDNDDFVYNVYNTIGNDVLGEDTCNKWRKEIAKIQWYLLTHKNLTITKTGKTLIETLWESAPNSKFSKFAQEHHECMYDLCVQEFATGFWQYEQDIETLIEVNNLGDSQEKLERTVDLLIKISGPDGYSVDGLFFAYHYQACTEMGEYNYDFSHMAKSLVDNGQTDDIEKVYDEIKVSHSYGKSLFWRLNFENDQYLAWYENGTQDMTLANKLIEWNQTCQVPVFMIYGGADTWYQLRLDETQKSDKIQVYVGKDPNDYHGRTHHTRISYLSKTQQDDIWAKLDAILK